MVLFEVCLAVDAIRSKAVILLLMIDCSCPHCVLGFCFCSKAYFPSLIIHCLL